MNQKIHTFMDDMKERTLSDAAEGTQALTNEMVSDMTPEEEFLANLLSGSDLSDLRDPIHDQEIYEEALSYLNDEQLERLHEREALTTVFDDIRERSHEGELTTCDYWETVGLVPEHMNAAAFTLLVLDTIQTAHEEAEKAKSEAAALEETDIQAEDVNAEETVSGTTEVSVEGVEANVETEGETANTEEESAEQEVVFSSPEVEAKVFEMTVFPAWDIEDIQVLEGSEKYLYSQRNMTDNFAHWAFLAAEDNDVLTLIDNVRVESKIYPRPMKLTSLMHKPYYLTTERIWDAFHEAQESGDYPDIQTCSASNGDTYFYSTLYLSPAQAKALAQWISVEKKANM